MKLATIHGGADYFQPSKHVYYGLWLESGGQTPPAELAKLPPKTRMQKLREFNAEMKTMSKLVGSSVWRHLLGWGVINKLAKGEWSKENGQKLLIQLLDAGVKVPATLFWFGIIPPMPGKVWSYVFTALSIYGFLQPNSRVHAMLKRYIYPSTFKDVEREHRAKNQADPDEPEAGMAPLPADADEMSLDTTPEKPTARPRLSGRYASLDLLRLPDR